MACRRRTNLGIVLADCLFVNFEHVLPVPLRGQQKREDVLMAKQSNDRDPADTG
jgi:hypothetical protein